jgi:hypothetical protein
MGASSDNDIELHHIPQPGLRITAANSWKSPVSEICQVVALACWTHGTLTRTSTPEQQL